MIVIGLARPATFLALAILARALFALRPTLGGYGALLGVLAWCYAVNIWWRNRRLGLHHLRHDLRHPILT